MLLKRGGDAWRRWKPGVKDIGVDDFVAAFECFKLFTDLPEDTYEAFLSAPVIARNRVVGVINVQHRSTHQHTGNEMEVLTTVGEQVGCLLVLARMDPTAVAAAIHVELVLSSGPVQPLKR